MITRLPLAALIIASLFWGTAVSVTKYALRGFGPVTLLAISLITGTALLWTIVILRGHRPPPPWRRAVLLGLFEPALAYAADLLGLARTSAANGALLSGLESVFIVLLAAIFLRERITGRITVALALALAGVATLEGTGSFAGAGLGVYTPKDSSAGPPGSQHVMPCRRSRRAIAARRTDLWSLLPFRDLNPTRTLMALICGTSRLERSLAAAGRRESTGHRIGCVRWS